MSNDFEDDYTRAEHALTFIHDNADRDTWVQVGMALKDGLAEAGLDLWKIWSSTAHNYDEKTCESSWRNFKTGKITFATVFGLAKANGWLPRAPSRKLTPEERAAKQAEREAKAKEVEQTQAERKARTQKWAQDILTKALAKPKEPHPYLVRKGFSDLPVPIYRGNLKLRSRGGEDIPVDGCFIVPLRDFDGVLCSLQFISNDVKLYLPGPRDGGVFMVPREHKNGDPIMLGEGVATMLSVKAANPGVTVVAGMDANGVVAAAEEIRKRFPNSVLTICADHDAAGLKAANKAAEHGATIIVPETPGDDFNDVHAKQGLDAVAKANDQRTPPMAPIAKTDHLAIAAHVINSAFDQGRNLLACPSGTYLYNGKIWESVTSDAPLKRAVVNSIQGFFDGVSSGMVNGAVDMLKTTAYREDDPFSAGHRDDSICVENGMLRLGNGAWQLDPHKRDDYALSLIPVSYDPAARASRFEQYLTDIFDGDNDAKDKARCLLEIIGYSLTRTTRFERMAFLYGGGANGKSVLIDIMRAMVGPTNDAAVQPGEFGNKFQLAHLHRKLVNMVTETSKGVTLNDAMLKTLTSGEPLTVEHKNQNPFTFRSYATLWIATNNMPHVADLSHGLFRRMLVIELNNRFVSGRTPDPSKREKRGEAGFTDRLKQELPGILNLALAAYAEAVKRGSITEPPSSITAKDAWRLRCDQADRFKQDRLAEGDGLRLPYDDLMREYDKWCDSENIRQSARFSKHSLLDRLRELGIQTGKGSKGVRQLSGWGLKSQW